VYNTNTVLGNEPLIVNYYIQTFENKRILDNYNVLLRKTSAEVLPVMSEINITQLPSGNYQLVINVKSKSNDLLASKDIFFQRTSLNATNSNSTFANSFADNFTDSKVLAENIACLQPISNSLESEFINNQLKLADIDLMKKFFFDFWQKRDAANPESSWLQYKAEVDKVQQSYGTRAVKGYNTDIGRVYLQYGAPSTITKSENEPTAYPYEIWRYNKIKNFTNKVFVFWNKDLIGKNYALLHSDMPGEVSDSQWNFKLHGRTMRAENYDDEIKKVNLSGDKTQENFNKK
jgi:GWxTD domain-containing protein